VHQAPITHHGWTGEGYIILDPETGAGAYKISGGADGGWLMVLAGAVIFGVMLPVTAAGLFFAFYGLLVAALTIATQADDSTRLNFASLFLDVIEVVLGAMVYFGLVAISAALLWVVGILAVLFSILSLMVADVQFSQKDERYAVT
jgi:hypothetical protein